LTTRILDEYPTENFSFLQSLDSKKLKTTVNEKPPELARGGFSVQVLNRHYPRSEIITTTFFCNKIVLLHKLE
jgi:hypothetical protein